jgi:hypothetical protein
MKKITIETSSVAELKELFEEMFPQATPVTVTMEVKPEPPPAEKPAPKKAAKPAPPPPPEPTVEDELEAEERVSDYDTTLNRIKSMKAGAHPDIIDKVKGWRDGSGFPSLKEMTPQQLGACQDFLDTLG